MPSCSTSSNIQASINALTVTQGGSRLLVSVPYVAGLTNGNVIRYDVITAGYTAAKADLAESSEVFGVIEGYNTTNNTFTTVIYGSISLDSSNFADMGSGGGSGGNDIYFLSGLTAGVLQNLAPTDLDHIVKPVYQAAPHGAYSGVIINYLGYKIGGEVEATNTSEVIGNIELLYGNSEFSDGYVDASVSHELSVSDYPEFYSDFGTQYGYVERLTVDESVAGSIIPNLKGTQTTSSYSGTVVSVDYANKYIYVFKAPGTELASTSKKVSFNTTGGSTKYTINTTQIHAVHTPVITMTQPISVTGKSGTNIDVTQSVKIGIKVKPTGTQVSIPTNVNITSLSAQSIALGAGEDDVETLLNDFESRISAIEARLRM